MAESNSIFPKYMAIKEGSTKKNILCVNFSDGNQPSWITFPVPHQLNSNGTVNDYYNPANFIRNSLIEGIQITPENQININTANNNLVASSTGGTRPDQVLEFDEWTKSGSVVQHTLNLYFCIYITHASWLFYILANSSSYFKVYDSHTGANLEIVPTVSNVRVSPVVSSNYVCNPTPSFQGSSVTYTQTYGTNGDSIKVYSVGSADAITGGIYHVSEIPWMQPTQCLIGEFRAEFLQNLPNNPDNYNNPFRNDEPLFILYKYTTDIVDPSDSNYKYKEYSYLQKTDGTNYKRIVVKRRYNKNNPSETVVISFTTSTVSQGDVFNYIRKISGTTQLGTTFTFSSPPSSSNPENGDGILIYWSSPTEITMIVNYKNNSSVVKSVIKFNVVRIFTNGTTLLQINNASSIANSLQDKCRMYIWKYSL